MNSKKLIRIIIYEGEEAWLKGTMQGNYLKGQISTDFGTITEIFAEYVEPEGDE